MSLFGALFRFIHCLGSSGNSGESGSDFEEEVFVVAESVGHSLDDFDLVVEAFEQAGVEGPGGVGDDAGEIGFEFPGEGDEGFDGALDGAAEPAFPGRLCRAFGSLFPQPLEVFLNSPLTKSSLDEVGMV